MEKIEFKFTQVEKKDNKSKMKEKCDYIYDNLQLPYWIIIKARDAGSFALLDRIIGDIKHNETFTPHMKYMWWVLKKYNND